MELMVYDIQFPFGMFQTTKTGESCFSICFSKWLHIVAMFQLMSSCFILWLHAFLYVLVDGFMFFHMFQ